MGHHELTCTLFQTKNMLLSMEEKSACGLWLMRASCGDFEFQMMESAPAFCWGLHWPNQTLLSWVTLKLTFFHRPSLSLNLLQPFNVELTLWYIIFFCFINMIPTILICVRKIYTEYMKRNLKLWLFMCLKKKKKKKPKFSEVCSNLMLTLLKAFW